jgi:MFS family permease
LVIAPLLPNPGWVLVLLWVGMTMLVTPSALAPAMLQSVCPNEMRGQIFSVYLLIMSSFAYVLGPLSVAWTADHLLHAENALSASLAVMAGIGTAGAAICLIAARRQHRALLAAAA